MDTAIVVSIITGAVTLIGTIITVVAGNLATKQQIQVQQAVMETKISNLTEEVKKHNSFTERLPVVEEQIKMINRRIDDLEKRA